MEHELAQYLQATDFLDYDAPEVDEFAERVCIGCHSQKEKAIRLYYAVRDEIRYDPYNIEFTPAGMKASTIIKKGSGFCVAKAVVLTAVARQQGIPARLGFADVQNHLSTARLRETMGSDVFIFHGYTEFLLDNHWVKSTPAFNLALCQRFQVKPLDFDGEVDSIFHEFNALGQKHMQYLTDHGTFADLPFALLLAAFQKHYPAMFDPTAAATGDFHTEAEQEAKEK